MKDTIISNDPLTEGQIFDAFKLEAGQVAPMTGAIITAAGLFIPSHAEIVQETMLLYGVVPLPPGGPGRATILKAHHGSAEPFCNAVSLNWGA